MPTFSPHRLRRAHASRLALASSVAIPTVILSAAGSAVAQEKIEHPDTLELTGIVRDFREHDREGGHPDFDRVPTGGFGLIMGNVEATLGDDMKPDYTGIGRKVFTRPKNRDGLPIAWTVAGKGHHGLLDGLGTFGSHHAGGIQSAASFAQWFTDVPGVNMSQELTITLHRQDDGTYVFDDKQDPKYRALGGFFPIEHQLFGNPGGWPDRNFHFTYELHTEFTYDADGEQVFRFTGDDDVWVYINDQLVIDLGGIHSAVDQYVELDRLDLEDGETYHLAFFFAERHRTQSNFRIQTNLALESVPLQPVTDVFD